MATNETNEKIIIDADTSKADTQLKQIIEDVKEIKKNEKLEIKVTTTGIDANSSKNVADLATELKSLSTAVGGEKTGATSRINNLRTAIDNFSRRLNTRATNITALSSSLGGLSAQVKNLSSATDNIKGFIDTLYKIKSAVTGFVNLSQEFTTGMENIKKTASAFNSLANSVNKIANLNSNLQTATTTLRNLSNALLSVANVPNFDSTVNNLKTIIRILSTVQKANTSFDRMGQVLRNLSQDLGDFVTRTTGLATTADSLRLLNTQINRLVVTSARMNNISISFTSLVNSLRGLSLNIPVLQQLSNALGSISNNLNFTGRIRGVNSFVRAMQNLNGLSLNNFANVARAFRVIARSLRPLLQYATILDRLAVILPRINNLQRTTANGMRMVGAYARNASVGVDSYWQSFKNILTDTRRLGASIFILINGFKTLQGFGEQLDRMTVVRNKIRSLYDDESQVADITNRIYTASQDARTSMDDFATTFLKVQLSTERYGLTAEQAIQITNTLAKAMVVGGATASETSSVMLQFSQALSKGKLDGDEFRSVMENSPVLMRALAKEAGKAMGVVGAGQKELMKWSKEGKLTIDILLQTLLNAEGEIGEKFARTNETIDQSFTKLSNTWSIFIDQVAQGSGLNNYIRSVLGRLNEFFSTMANAVGVIAKRVASWGGYLLKVYLSYRLVMGVASRLLSIYSTILGFMRAGIGTYTRTNLLALQNLEYRRQDLILTAQINRADAFRNVLIERHQMIQRQLDNRRILSQERYNQLLREERNLRIAIRGAGRQGTVLSEARRAGASRLAGLDASNIGIASAMLGRFILRAGGLYTIYTAFASIKEAMSMIAKTGSLVEKVIRGDANAVKQLGSPDIEPWLRFADTLYRITGIDVANIRRLNQEFQKTATAISGISHNVETAIATDKPSFGEELIESASTLPHRMAKGFVEGVDYLVKAVDDSAGDAGVSIRKRFYQQVSPQEIQQGIPANIYPFTPYKGEQPPLQKTFEEMIYTLEHFEDDAGGSLKQKSTLLLKDISEVEKVIADATLMNIDQKFAEPMVRVIEHVKQAVNNPEFYSGNQKELQKMIDTAKQAIPLINKAQHASSPLSAYQIESSENIANAKIKLQRYQLVAPMTRLFKDEAEAYTNQTVKYAKSLEEYAKANSQSQIKIYEIVDKEGKKHLEYAKNNTKLSEEMYQNYKRQADYSLETANLFEEMATKLRNANDLTPDRVKQLQEVAGLIKNDKSGYAKEVAQIYDKMLNNEELSQEEKDLLEYVKSVNTDFMKNMFDYIKSVADRAFADSIDAINKAKAYTVGGAGLEIINLGNGMIKATNTETKQSFTTHLSSPELQGKSAESQVAFLAGKTEKPPKEDKKGRGGHGRRREFDIPWLDMRELGGNWYDSRNPEKILATFEDMVGTNKNLLFLNTEMTEWYSEQAKLLKKASEAGVNLSESDLNRLQTLFLQRRHMEEVADAEQDFIKELEKEENKRQTNIEALNDLIEKSKALNKPTEAYTNLLKKQRDFLVQINEETAKQIKQNKSSDFVNDWEEQYQKREEALRKQRKTAGLSAGEKIALRLQAYGATFDLAKSKGYGEAVGSEYGKNQLNTGVFAKNFGYLEAYKSGNLSSAGMANYMGSGMSDFLSYVSQFGTDQKSDMMLNSMGLDPEKWGEWSIAGLNALSQLTDGFKGLSVTISETLGNALTTFTNGLADGLANAIVKGEDFRETMANVAQTIAVDLISSLIKMGIQWAVTQLMMTAVTEEQQAMVTGSSILASKAVATAWAVPATYVATATMGGAVTAGQTALLGATIANQARALFAEGGYTGNGGKYEPAGIVHKGEYVFSQEDVNRIGLSNLEAMHNGSSYSTNTVNNYNTNGTGQVSIVNMVDPNMLKSYLQTSEGQQAIINTIKQNPRTVRQIIQTA